MPLPVSRRARAQVHRHVKDLPCHHPYQLILGIINLEMQPPQHIFHRGGLVILDKHLANPGFLKIVIIIGFHKIAPRIPIDGGSDNF